MNIFVPPVPHMRNGFNLRTGSRLKEQPVLFYRSLTRDCQVWPVKAWASSLKMTLEIAETASNMWESERKLWKEYAQKLKKFWGSSLVDEVHQRIAEAVMWRDLWKVWPIYCEYIRILTDKLEEDPKDVP